MSKCQSNFDFNLKRKKLVEKISESTVTMLLCQRTKADIQTVFQKCRAKEKKPKHKQTLTYLFYGEYFLSIDR